ncbi:MAG: hypothetical protein U7M05_00990 [Candidatus Igneacidithiobacillus chanchocoensis]
MSADAWQPFKTVNALSPDIPKRGQGETSPAVLLIGRLMYRGITLTLDGCKLSASPSEALTPEDMAAIKEHRAALVAFLTPEQERPRPSLEEQLETEAALALQTMGREPTAKETEQAQADARALLSWLRKNWHGTMTGPSFFDELEAELYRVGILSTFWGLRGDRDTLRELLAELRHLEDKAGRDFLGALHRAHSREGQEWHVVALAVGQMEYQAKALNSPRLAEAAKVMRAMLTPDRLRPEAPAEATRKELTKNANKARTDARDAIWGKIEAAMREQRGMKAVDTRAAVAKLALQWNLEAQPSASGKAPFGWETEAQAAEAIRLHMMRAKKKK